MGNACPVHVGLFSSPARAALLDYSMVVIKEIYILEVGKTGLPLGRVDEHKAMNQLLPELVGSVITRNNNLEKHHFVSKDIQFYFY